MSTHLAIRCVNCGAALESGPDVGASVRCPVCQFPNDVGAAPQTTPFTRDSLEHGLGALIAQARASGLANEDIIEALRDELEFAAELAHLGRNMYVQIIDLGPLEGQAAPQPAQDRVVRLRSRALGG